MSDTAEHFDAVVVGSGFGGSVTAFNLAQGGRRVLVLERGRPYPPGSFARSPRTMKDNFWDPSAGLHGLFNVWSFRSLEALVSAGLGGGSLIYANVLIRKDENWFVTEQPFDGGYENWPIDRASLDPHYDRVEAMLGANPYPYKDTAKTVAMREAANRLGLDWKLPNLAVTFAGSDGIPQPGVPVPEAGYPNYHGMARRTCRLCGECDIGCNDGAKNTMDHTYISAAKAAGAEIRTRCEVRRIRPVEGGGFEVAYVAYGPEHEGQAIEVGDLPHVTVSSDRLVLGAGTLGTTYLLLRNQANFPELGSALGTHFSGNGDLLTLAMGAKRDGEPRRLDAARGPVITSTVRVPDEMDGGDGRGYYIQDAGFPEFVEWIMEGGISPATVKRLAAFAAERVEARLTGHADSDLSAEITGVIGEAIASSTSMPLLGMGRDIPDGQMSLREGYLDVDWSTESSAEFLERMRGTMRDIAGVLEAEYHDNPLWKLRQRVITVHPLGGAPMGRHVGEGVVDEYGESFAYPGLHVVDGAVMPGPVGANPALTIAAFSDRAARRILESWERVAPRRAIAADAEVDPVRPASHQAPDETVTRLRFTEEMKGHFTLGDLPYEEAADRGEENRTSLMFRLTIEVVDVDGFIDDPEREGSAVGWINCEQLGGRLPVERGVFNLFVPGDEPGVRRMLYRLWFADSMGNPLTLVGFKTVRDEAGLDVWPDTSTLYIRVLQGHVEPESDSAADVVATGILRILVVDFLQQLTTFRVNGPDAGSRVGALSTFGRLFGGELWQVYGGRAERAVEK